MPTFDARSRRVRALALAAAFVLAPATARAGSPVWDAQETAALVAQDPWTGVGDAAYFAVDDAYIFSDPQRGPGLDEDAAAVAVKADRDRIAVGVDPGAEAAAGGRVTAAFGAFVTIGPEGLAYASTEVARSGAAVARIARVSLPVAARMAMAEKSR